MSQQAVSLKKLLPNVPDDLSKHEIKGLCIDSRMTQPGDLFLAYPGVNTDGRLFLQDAFKRGAEVAFIEADGVEHFEVPEGLQVELIKNLAGEVSSIASRFYSDPSQQFRVVGVTGTNGKTSICHFLSQATHLLGKPYGIIGTLGSGFHDAIQPGLLTTPDPIQLHAHLKMLLEQKAHGVAIEISSHALAQQRVQGVDIDVAVFTNLTREHLDYHTNMENYFSAKYKLFTDYNLETAIINVSSPFGQKIIEKGIAAKKVITFSEITNAYDADYYPIAQHPGKGGTQLEVHTPFGDETLTLPLIGQHNISNSLATLAVLLTEGFSLKNAMHALSCMVAPPGRLQSIPNEKGIKIFIDYAHTPDALQHALSTLRQVCKGSLRVVFGCGGNRWQSKRPLMGAIAACLADHIIITDDNPRQEEPNAIIKDIISDIKHENLQVIQPRKEAIRACISAAKPDDVVLIAGKGHETFQHIGSEGYYFSDLEEAQVLLQESSP